MIDLGIIFGGMAIGMFLLASVIIILRGVGIVKFEFDLCGYLDEE